MAQYMEEKEQKAAIAKPYKYRLKDLGMGLAVGRVLGKRILVKPLIAYTEMDAVEKKGLIMIPESVKDQNTPPPTTGVIVMVGPEVKSVRDGEMVMFSRYAGMDIMVDAGEFKILDEAEIVCVLEATTSAGTAAVE